MTTEIATKRDYASVFIHSAVDVFNRELSVPLKKRSLNIKHSSKPSYPLSIVIGFVGASIKGQVVYSMGKEVGEMFVKKMFPNMLPAKRREMLDDILGEVANMISGKASIMIAGNDSMIDITPPIVITGESNFHFLQVPTVVLILDSLLGSLEINIAFRELSD